MLPAGLHWTAKGSHGLISGVPKAGHGGAYPLTIVATTAWGQRATRTITLIITQPPRFVSGDTASFRVGAARQVRHPCHRISASTHHIARGAAAGLAFP